MATPLHALRAARRLYPLALAGYQRWQSLTPAEKERYMKMARGWADRGRAGATRASEEIRRRSSR